MGPITKGTVWTRCRWNISCKEGSRERERERQRERESDRDRDRYLGEDPTQICKSALVDQPFERRRSYAQKCYKYLF